MHITRVKICGQYRSCISRPTFSNAQDFVFVTVNNGLFDDSLGQTINQTIVSLIDRALRSGAISLQMSGQDMIGKTTFAIYKSNINTPVLHLLIQQNDNIQVDNIECVRSGMYSTESSNMIYFDTWNDIVNTGYDVATGSVLEELEEQHTPVAADESLDPIID